MEDDKRPYEPPKILRLENSCRALGACVAGSGAGDDCAITGASATGDCVGEGASAASSCMSHGVSAFGCTIGASPA